MKRFQVALFGKEGCDKCEVLKKRLDKILQEKPYEEFEFVYCDLGTVEGLVRFCRSDVLNPQRIPSFMVFHKETDQEEADPDPLRCRREISAEEEIETFLALETDYKTTGIISPKMIKNVLDQALKKIPADV